MSKADNYIMPHYFDCVDRIQSLKSPHDLLVNFFGRPVAGLIRSVRLSFRVTYSILTKRTRLQEFYTYCSLLFRP